MKKSRSIISLVLTLAMLLALCVPVLAADGKTDPYDTYLCIGDSVSAGAGMPLPEGTEVDTSNMPGPVKDTADKYYWGYDYGVVPESCHDLIAKALSNDKGDATKLIQGARSALRAVEVRYMLEGGALHDVNDNNDWDAGFFANEDGAGDFNINDINRMNSYVGGEEGKSMADQVRKADLITVELGLNDVFGTAVASLYNKYVSDESENSPATVLKKLVDGRKELDLKTIAVILLGMRNLDTIQIAQDIQDALDESVDLFRENYDAVLTLIKLLNPDAQVVAVGAYNPLEGATVLLNTLETASVGSAKVNKLIVSAKDMLKEALDETNEIIRDTAVDHGYYFVDISDTKTWGVTLKDIDLDSSTLAGDLFAKIHPSDKGHKYIAEQVLAVLSQKLGDLDMDGLVTDADAIYLYNYLTQDKHKYPVYESVDYDGNGVTEEADAILLLNHSLKPDRYQLTASE